MNRRPSPLWSVALLALALAFSAPVALAQSGQDANLAWRRPRWTARAESVPFGRFRPVVGPNRIGSPGGRFIPPTRHKLSAAKQPRQPCLSTLNGPFAARTGRTARFPW